MRTVLAAVCLPLVDAPECWNPSGSRWWRLSWRHHCAGNSCCCQGGSTSWAHNSQTFHSSQQRHTGLFCSFPTRSMTLRVVTENKWAMNKWAMKRQEGNGRKGHSTRTWQRDENGFREMRDTDSFNLEPMSMWQHWKSAYQCVNCALWCADEKIVRLRAYK